MRREWLVAVLMCVASLAGPASEVLAQPIGSFRWQLQPFCNVLTLAVTQNGGIYTLDGFDDQCGAAQRASIVGTAVVNPDGSVNLGMITVLAPSGFPVHIDARIDLNSLGGTWRDSAGNAGAFVFTSGVGTGGLTRPVASNGLAPNSVTTTQIAPGAIGGAQIDSAQVQARVTGSCPIGQYLRGINANGTVVCEPSGAALVKRTAFEFVQVAGQSAPPTALTTTTFVAPISGVALLRGRGYCNLSSIPGSSNIILLGAGTSAADALTGLGISDVGVASVPEQASGLYQVAWSAERILNVSGGTSYGVGLFARHESGNFSNYCFGSFTVQLSGVLQ